MIPSFALMTAALVGALLSGLGLLRLGRLRQRRTRQARGLVWLRHLRHLLMLLQQHRGLSTGYLNGSRDLQVDIDRLQQSIRRCLADSVAVDSSWLGGNERWRGLTEHWQRLGRRYRQLAVANNLNQHNLLIQNLLYLIDDMAQEHDLLLIASDGDKPLRIAWQSLLTAAECLGQARAVGTGAVARGECDTLARIRLNYLWQKAEQTTTIAWAQAPPSQHQRAKVHKLLGCLQREVTQPSIAMSVTDFFAMATEAIDSLYEQYDQLLAQARMSR